MSLDMIITAVFSEKRPTIALFYRVGISMDYWYFSIAARAKKFPGEEVLNELNAY